MPALTDLDFRRFDWGIAANGDLATRSDLDAFRQVIYHWLLTGGTTATVALSDEEIEQRRGFASAEDRVSEYDPPDGQIMRACLPWDPSWGVGIKRYLNGLTTPEALRELQTVVETGLARLPGVSRVLSVRVSATGTGAVTIAWSVNTIYGRIEDSYRSDGGSL